MNTLLLVKIIVCLVSLFHMIDPFRLPVGFIKIMMLIRKKKKYEFKFHDRLNNTGLLIFLYILNSASVFWLLIEYLSIPTPGYWILPMFGELSFLAIMFNGGSWVENISYAEEEINKSVFLYLKDENIQSIIRLLSPESIKKHKISHQAINLALRLAVEKNNIEAAELFLKKGANPNFRKEKSCYTHVMSAAAGNDIDMLQLLLKHGASKSPKTSILDIKGNIGTYYMRNALWIASRGYNVEAYRVLKGRNMFKALFKNTIPKSLRAKLIVSDIEFYADELNNQISNLKYLGYPYDNFGHSRQMHHDTYIMAGIEDLKEMGEAGVAAILLLNKSEKLPKAIKNHLSDELETIKLTVG